MRDSQSLSRQNIVPTVIALGLTLSFFVLALNRLDLMDKSFLTSLDYSWMDAKFRFRGQVKPAGDELVIVAMDERTLDKLGSARTLTRDKMANLVARLSAAEPKVIGFDITYPEPDVSNPENDRKFAAAVAAAGNVVMSCYLELENTAGRRREARLLDSDFERLVVEKEIFPAERRAGGGSREIDAMILGQDLELSLPILNKAAASFGFVNFHADEEGRLRYQPQFIEYEGHLFPSLDLQVLRRYLDAPSIVVDIESGRIAEVQLGNYTIPTDRYGRFMLSYLGPRDTFPTYSMIDVLEGHVSPDLFKNKIVLVGALAVGLSDVIATPFDPVLPGVELHASVIENVLHRRFLRRDAFTKSLDITLIIAFGFAAAYFLPRMNASRSVVYTILTLAAFVAFNVWTFLSPGWVLSFIYPGLSLVLTSGVLIAYKYLTEEREKKRTRQTFQYYLDRNIIAEVMNEPEKLKLGGEKQELTVLFSDIRGFTSFSEKMAPTEVVIFLNEYFDRMTALIFQYKGTLDKFMGDAVMCFWGHPIETKDHAARATITALEMVRAVEDLRGVLVLPGGAKLEIGVGVNTGQMIVGNMGSQNRFSYTVMGDNVNLGSRLESLNKHYSTRVIISDTTYGAVKDFIFCRELDTIQVKGRSQALTIYEPLGIRRVTNERRVAERRGKLTPAKRVVRAFVLRREGERRKGERRLGSSRLVVTAEQEEMAAIYEHALALYREGDFDAAEMAFSHVLSLSPRDGPSRLMKARIVKYRAEHADAHSRFDPVFKFDEK